MQSGSEPHDPQAQLWKEIQTLSVHCYVCRATEEENRVEILVDLSECAKSICCVCYLRNKDETCTRCAKKIELHYSRKNKNTMYQRAMDQARKLYNREHKVWSTEEYKQLDTDFVGLMAYFALQPPQKSNRKGYEEAEREIKGILKRKNKEDRSNTWQGDRHDSSGGNRFGQAILLSHTNDDTATGKEATGYDDRSYAKGFALIRGCQW